VQYNGTARNEHRGFPTTKSIGQVRTWVYTFFAASSTSIAADTDLIVQTRTVRGSLCECRFTHLQLENRVGAVTGHGGSATPLWFNWDPKVDDFAWAVETNNIQHPLKALQPGSGLKIATYDPVSRDYYDEFYVSQMTWFPLRCVHIINKWVVNIHALSSPSHGIEAQSLQARCLMMLTSTVLGAHVACTGQSDVPLMVVVTSLITSFCGVVAPRTPCLRSEA
jgi:hypothetical protein